MRRRGSWVFPTDRSLSRDGPRSRLVFPKEKTRSEANLDDRIFWLPFRCASNTVQVALPDRQFEFVSLGGIIEPVGYCLSFGLRISSCSLYQRTKDDRSESSFSRSVSYGESSTRHSTCVCVGGGCSFFTVCQSSADWCHMSKHKSGHLGRWTKIS